MSRRAAFIVLLVCLILFLSACGSSPKQDAEDKEVTLVLGAYSVAKEAFEQVIPAFQEQWLQETGQKVRFQESYEASGAQVRAISGGFEADIAVLALEGDLDRLVKNGEITHDWRSAPYRGMITRSVAALGVREGNPKGIKDWNDLLEPGTEVLFANPKTSGGAQWIINAIYGAGLKESEQQQGQASPKAAKAFLRNIYSQVISMDKSSRASMTTFENGVGDAIVTYENELLARVRGGVPYGVIVPSNTIQIENPAAVVDANVDKHGTRKVAEAFLQFLWSDKAQRILADKGFRPVVPEIYQAYQSNYVDPPGLFRIEDLGGWGKVQKTIYAPRGIWEQVLIGD